MGTGTSASWSYCKGRNRLQRIPRHQCPVDAKEGPRQHVETEQARVQAPERLRDRSAMKRKRGIFYAAENPSLTEMKIKTQVLRNRKMLREQGGSGGGYSSVDMGSRARGAQARKVKKKARDKGLRPCTLVNGGGGSAPHRTDDSAAATKDERRRSIKEAPQDLESNLLCEGHGPGAHKWLSHME